MAGAANGFMDALQFHGAWSKLGNEQFWNPNKSWINKWEIDEAGKAIAGKERFWGSSTFLVFLTDGWHLVKWIYLLSVKLAIVTMLYFPVSRKKIINLLTWVGIFAAITLAMSAGFHLTYSIIF